MKKLIPLSLICLFLMGIGTAQAQTAQQPLGFKLMYGQQSYRGDLGNEIFQYTGNDPLVGVGMSAYLNRYFGVALEAQYLPLDKKNGPGDAVFKKRNTYFKTDDFNMNLTLHIKPFKTRLNPYAAIGVGGNFLKAKDNITKKDHHFMFTLPFGAGINYKINSLLMLNVEAIYHRGFNDWKIDHYPMPNSKATQYAINHEPQHNFNRNIDGKNHDDFFTTSVGLVFNFGGGKSKKSIQERMLEQSMKNLKAAQNASDQASNTLQQAQQLNDKTLAALDSLKAARHQSQQKAQELKSELGEIVNNVQFAFDKSNIIDPAKKELNSLANILNHFPSLNVNIAGHADKRGSSTYNKKLSERRAQAVKSYLVNHGVSSSRITTNAYGQNKPLIHGSTPTDYAQNRSVQITLSYNPSNNNMSDNSSGY